MRIPGISPNWLASLVPLLVLGIGGIAASGCGWGGSDGGAAGALEGGAGAPAPATPGGAGPGSTAQGPDSTSNSGSGIAPAGQPPDGVDPGLLAPPFELPRLGSDGRVKLADLRGKVVLLSFWASWCGPCRVEIPELESTWQQYKDKDVAVVGISVDDTKGDASGFLSMFPVSYPMLFDEGGGAVGNPWRVSSIPMSVLIDKRGVIRKKHLGYTPKQLREIQVEIDKLLGEAS
jgi:peroxiredoxin